MSLGNYLRIFVSVIFVVVYLCVSICDTCMYLCKCVLMASVYVYISVSLVTHICLCHCGQAAASQRPA